MFSNEIYGSYVSEKVSKIRWKPDAFNESTTFTTGSYSNTNNYIKVWGFRDAGDTTAIPYKISETAFAGDVTEMYFLNPDYFLASSTEGFATLYQLGSPEDSSLSIKQEKKWSQLHTFVNGDECPCTSFALHDENFVTVGEDGILNVLNIHSDKPLRIIEADTCSLNCVIFLRHNEVLTGNMRGQLKIWDLRNELDKAVSTLNDDQITSTCLAYHPTQRHLVIAGDEEGSLSIWDLRQNHFPVNIISGHSGPVTELQFHPDYPDVVCSASLSGELWLWKTNQSKSRIPNNLLGIEEEGNVWYSGESSKNKLETSWLMPRLHKAINGLDLYKNKVLCGCDNEAFYLINDIFNVG